MDFAFPLSYVDTSGVSLLDLGVFLLTVLLENLFPFHLGLDDCCRSIPAEPSLSPMHSRHWCSKHSLALWHVPHDTMG